MRDERKKPIIEALNIGVKLRSFCLEISYFALYPGEILVVLGPNGAGKSTLLKVLGFQQRVTKGRILFNGIEVKARDSLWARRQMSCVFQRPLLLNRSVYKNVELGLRLRSIPRRVRQAQVKEWLSKLKILHLIHRKPLTLSGGEAQRVNLARALVTKPKVLLLDEPFSGLDLDIKKELYWELRRLISSMGIGALFVTHDLYEAFELADRMIVLLNGKIHELARSKEKFLPMDKEVAQFLGFGKPHLPFL
jgi:tungstate transport system ATP-binding protein